MLTTYQIISGITRSKTYRLRYRTSNGIGWSDFSPILYALAANVPSRPPAPVLLIATGNSITLKLFESSDDGGSRVQFYELWRESSEESSFV
jgi:hypothetical protein